MILLLKGGDLPGSRLYLLDRDNHTAYNKKQAEGIARAKARGVRFGSRQKPLPENFEEARRSWRGGETSLKEAAKLCGMPTTTFYDAVRRAEESEPGENEEEVPRC